MTMMKVEIKFERKSTTGLSMSQMMEDIMTIEETPLPGSKERKPLVLQWEDINLKDNKVEFNSSDSWDVKENMLKLVKAIEAFSWVESIISIKRSKKT